jgi:hypothetical protein
MMRACGRLLRQDAVESRRMVGVVMQYLNARGLWQSRSSLCNANLRLLQQVLACPLAVSAASSPLNAISSHG